ncbi:MAG: hypothetical protein MJ086_06640 [Lachnospiraceae bacterium]|nr:hypothetical protein [Lachnospiraceae bacterium]
MKKQKNEENKNVYNDILESAVAFGKDVASKMKKSVGEAIEKEKEEKNIAKTVKKVAETGKTTAVTVKDKVVGTLDQDKSGQVDIGDIIILAFKTPGVKINRESFLRKELFKKYPEEVVNDAVARTPALAGITPEDIEKISNDVIESERIKVSGISAALGVPGGWAIAATIPADITQYYGYTLRATQKLLYLYGFPEITVDQDGVYLDSETINEIIICLGVMNGVAGANNAIKSIAKAFATGVEKKLLNTALTKGTIYPIVKAVMKWFGVKLTKEVFAGFFKKAIPVAGGVIGGGITYLTFKPCCQRLKKVLKDTMLSNPKHQSTKEENIFVQEIKNGTVVDADFVEVDEVPEAEPFTVDEVEDTEE